MKDLLSLHGMVVPECAGRDAISCIALSSRQWGHRSRKNGVFCALRSAVCEKFASGQLLRLDVRRHRDERRIEPRPPANSHAC